MKTLFFLFCLVGEKPVRFEVDRRRELRMKLTNREERKGKEKDGRTRQGRVSGFILLCPSDW